MAEDVDFEAKYRAAIEEGNPTVAMDWLRLKAMATGQGLRQLTPVEETTAIKRHLDQLMRLMAKYVALDQQQALLQEMDEYIISQGLPDDKVVR
jgi:predicted lipase